MTIFKRDDKFIFYTDDLTYNDVQKWNENIIKCDIEYDYDFHIGIFFNFKQIGDTPASTTIISVNDLGTPLFAVIRLSKDFLNSRLNSNYIEALMLHELTHVLGFHEDIFIYEPNFNDMLMQEEINGVKHSYIKSPKVLEFARKYFNCSSLEKVEIETNSEGHYGSH